MSKANIFVSYAHSDSDLLKPIFRELKAQDVTYFDDKEISAGEKVLETINSALDEATSFIILISESYLESKWAGVELGYALTASYKRNGKMIPVVLDDVELPAFLRDRQFIDARSSTPQELAQKIKEVLGH